MDRNDLHDEFIRQAEWRREKAEDHPDDQRNIEAAQMHTNLAVSALEVPPEVMECARELFEEDSLEIPESWSEMMRSVGFSYFPKSAEAFVHDFIREHTGG
ncbi:hypothetical protein [Roseovarius sp.]|uniref:hypothetical protein n=1 Tax=Roseovarius sp. TaxID=1486281 RepID=UPI002621BE97|nr:hypothetical protein [Roseovarius sp.]MDM8167145.1 hypothetical protein [Roseovarius sp.]